MQLAVNAFSLLAERARIAVLHVAAQMDAQTAVTPQHFCFFSAASLRTR